MENISASPVSSSHDSGSASDADYVKVEKQEREGEERKEETKGGGR